MLGGHSAALSPPRGTTVLRFTHTGHRAGGAHRPPAPPARAVLQLCSSLPSSCRTSSCHTHLFYIRANTVCAKHTSHPARCSLRPTPCRSCSCRALHTRATHLLHTHPAQGRAVHAEHPRSSVLSTQPCTLMHTAHAGVFTNPICACARCNPCPCAHKAIPTRARRTSAHTHLHTPVCTTANK